MQTIASRIVDVTGRALLIDLDGTLADSLGPLKEAYFAFLAGLNRKGSETEFQQLNGLPLMKVIEALAENHGLSITPGEICGHYINLVRRAHASARPTEGAQALLRRACDTGWKVAVVTSGPRNLALAWLDRNNLSGCVDAVIGAEDVIAGKPAPDPYHAALARLGCTASHSVAVEDSLLGAQSAVAAGLTTCVLAPSSDQGGWPAGVTFIVKLPDLLDRL
jgi:HAD superfamily hydrolase (TIGR01509 family)